MMLILTYFTSTAAAAVVLSRICSATWLYACSIRHPMKNIAVEDEFEKDDREREREKEEYSV